MRAAFSSLPTAALPQIIAGDFPRVARKVTIVAGSGVLPAGTVLGRITASKKHTTSLAAANDGSEAVDVVLAEDVDATGADAEAIAWLSGDFHAEALTFGAGHTADGARDALRAKSIFI